MPGSYLLNGRVPENISADKMRDRNSVPKLFTLCLYIVTATYANASGFVAPDKLDFRHRNLSSVPSDVAMPVGDDAAAITKAIFSHNNFDVLSANDFERLARFPNLRYVFFDHNSVDSVEGGAFAQVPGTKFLELSHNSLKEISDEFYEDLNRLESLHYINLKRNPLKNYKNIDKLVAKGVQIDYDGVLGRERKMKTMNGRVVSDGTIFGEDGNEEPSPIKENLRLGGGEEADEAIEHSVEDEDDEERNSTRFNDKPVKAHIVDHKIDQNGNAGNFKVNSNFLGSIIFNFLAAFLVLVALPIAMVIYYFVHRRDAVS
ncbi:hypothetical protein Trydic_g14719 [Trypoxylus dichotomus]